MQQCCSSGDVCVNNSYCVPSSSVSTCLNQVRTPSCESRRCSCRVGSRLKTGCYAVHHTNAYTGWVRRCAPQPRRAIRTAGSAVATARPAGPHAAHPASTASARRPAPAAAGHCNPADRCASAQISSASEHYVYHLQFVRVRRTANKTLSHVCWGARGRRSAVLPVSRASATRASHHCHPAHLRSLDLKETIR